MNMILSFLLPVLQSLIAGVEYNSAEPIFYGVRKLVIFIAVGIIVIVLIVLAVRYLLRLRNKKTND